MPYKNVLCIIMGLICGFSLPGESGQTVITGYVINNGEGETINIVEQGYPSGDLRKYRIPILKTRFSQRIELTESSFFKILDGYGGHTIFLHPGDSISIVLEKVKNLEERQRRGEFISKFSRLRVQGAPFPGNILLMDQLDSLRMEWISKKVGLKHPSLYKSRCDSFYYSADSILQLYKTQQYISGEFYSYGKSAMNATYLLWICSIMANTPKDSLPAGYLEKARKLTFNNPEHARKVPGYMSAAYVQNVYAFSGFSPENPYANLKNLYTSIKDTRKGFIRDRLLSWAIIEYKNKNHPAFDSLYADFVTVCTDQKLKEEVNESLRTRQVSAQINNRGSVLSALNTPVTDLNGRIAPLSQMLAPDKITIIDNWATWCTPCLSELPFIHALDSAYRDKIQFIYLSYDSDKSSWEKFVAEEKHKAAHYWLKGNFTSPFAEVFDVSSIPRYIAIDGSKRRVLDLAMPRPSGKLFEAQIKSYFK